MQGIYAIIGVGTDDDDSVKEKIKIHWTAPSVIFSPTLYTSGIHPPSFIIERTVKIFNKFINLN